MNIGEDITMDEIIEGLDMVDFMSIEKLEYRKRVFLMIFEENVTDEKIKEIKDNQFYIRSAIKSIKEKLLSVGELDERDEKYREKVSIFCFSQLYDLKLLKNIYLVSDDEECDETNINVRYEIQLGKKITLIEKLYKFLTSKF